MHPSEKISELRSKGFEIAEEAKKEFDVVCVTKRREPNIAHFHRPVTGKAKVRHLTATRADLKVHLTVVSFNGKDYELLYVRNGLSGSALVIAIHNDEEPPYDTWELYTDTPSAKPDRTNETVTSEELRERAQTAISHSTR